MSAIIMILTHLKNLKRTIFIAAICLLAICAGALYKQNKALKNSLEIAETNILAYLGLLTDSLLANNVLRLDAEQLKGSKDSLLNELGKIQELLKIKNKLLALAATETQSITVNNGKKLDNKIIVKDSLYTDSIYYNDLTKVYYTIGTDTVNIALDIKNTEYFYVYSDRHYKNNKKFFKRLFTWDWKKITEMKYKTVNTNELFDIQDVRVVEINK